VSDQEIPTAPEGVGRLHSPRPFPAGAEEALADSQLRRNLANATSTIRSRRASVVAELDDWSDLRASGAAIKQDVLTRLDEHLLEFERRVTEHGGIVHWARDANEANRIIVGLVRDTGVREVVKMKSMLSQEIGLNAALESAGISAVETDLAELIVQLDHDEPSHILVPAIHLNRREIRDIFVREMPEADAAMPDDPAGLTAVARTYLRDKFLSAQVAITGVNFAIAETGTVSVVESEGNGRMCVTLPPVLISVMGIEKLVPSWRDLEVFLQLLPRSSTAERMNPYTSMWTGATGGQEFHLVLVDNGRTATLADPHGRDALRCIRCSACLNVCPVYQRVGGHAYGSTYPGPIGAVLSPQLTGVEANRTLPFASTLCGACLDVCPVIIDIPSMLVHLRARAVDADAASGHDRSEHRTMSTLAWVMRSPRRYARALRLLRLGRVISPRRHRLRRLPPPFSGWSRSRDLPVPPRRPFRDTRRKPR
jgi:L-lactate dehydrogenase complex protein LldF